MRLVDFVQLIMILKLNLRCSYNLLSRLYRHVVGLNGLKDGQQLDSRWKQQREVQETLVATKSRMMRREKLGAKLGSLRQLGFCTMRHGALLGEVGGYEYDQHLLQRQTTHCM